jgi:parallel beta-helix repeat protein/predicted outer membrane repeat protein
VYILDGNSYFTNVTISGNEAQGTVMGTGGGLLIKNANLLFTNVTITGNSADTFGGGIYSRDGSSLTMVNSILWNNSKQEICFEESNNPSTVTIYYTDIHGGQDSIVTNDNGTVTWGDGNVDIDPVFVDTANGNYNLLASSMLINAGHPDSTDSDGTVADIGAYPYLNSYSGPTWYISENGNDTTATGASGDPFRSIQAGINFSNNNDSVAVAAGTYTENIDFSGKNIVVIGENRETTIIDGDSSGSVVKFISGEDSTAVLMGFTITNGAAESGGGIHLDQSSPSLYDLTISQNTASSSGGGIYAYNHSNPILKNSIVVNNSSDINAGGIRCWDSSNMKLENVVIANNTAISEGGGMHCRGFSNPTLMNVTLINNSSAGSGGLYLRGDSTIIVNSIIWGNTPQNIKFREAGSPSHITFSYSDLEGGQDSIVTNDNGTVTWGDGNIDIYPVFADTANGDYHLSDLSPVISTATDSVQIGDTWFFAPATDVEGNARPSPEIHCRTWAPTRMKMAPGLIMAPYGMWMLALSCHMVTDQKALSSARSSMGSMPPVKAIRCWWQKKPILRILISVGKILL